MGWTEFALAFVVFFASHSIPVRPPVRPWLEARLGRGGFTLVYAVLSVAVLVWLIVAAGRAPYVGLWDRAPWQSHVALGAMLVMCLIAALAVGRPNPFSFGGGDDARFDPARPGLVRWMRHPLLGALAIWAGAHLLPNGDLVHVLLFGTFAGFAVLGRRLVDRRKRRELGDDWDRLRAEVADGAGHTTAFGTAELTIRVVAGLAVYGALILAHPLVLGVSPMP